MGRSERFFVTPLLKLAVRRIVWLATIVFMLVLLPYLYLYGLYLFGYPTKIEYPDKIPSIATWVWLPFFTVVTVGAFGAYFSRLIGISMYSGRFSTIELESAGTWRNLFLRGAVGILGAFVLFLFLKSGLVQGNMFPDFTKMGLDFISYNGSVDGGTDAAAKAASLDAAAKAASLLETMHLIMPSNALALLAMWSFLAGFSERLVPSILRTPNPVSQKAQTSLVEVSSRNNQLRPRGLHGPTDERSATSKSAKLPQGLTGPASWRKRRAPGRGLRHDRRSASDRFFPARRPRRPARRRKPSTDCGWRAPRDAPAQGSICVHRRRQGRTFPPAAPD